MKFSYFESFCNKHTNKWAPSSNGIQMNMEWNDFISFIEDCSEKKWNEKTNEISTNAPLISPAYYSNEQCHRSNEEVILWNSLFLDVDENGLEQFDILVNKFNSLNINYIIYSSPRCTETEWKYRVIVPLDMDVELSMIDTVKQCWDSFTNNVCDEACSDESRCYYVPGIYGDNTIQFKVCVNTGDNLSLEWLLSNYYKEPEIKLESVQTLNSLSLSENEQFCNELINIIKNSKSTLNYKEWQLLTYSIANTCNIEIAKAIMKNYYPEQKKDEYNNLFKSFRSTSKPSTIGSLIYIAKECDAIETKKLVIKYTPPSEVVIPINSNNFNRRIR